MTLMLSMFKHHQTVSKVKNILRFTFEMYLKTECAFISLDIYWVMEMW